MYGSDVLKAKSRGESKILPNNMYKIIEVLTIVGRESTALAFWLRGLVFKAEKLQKYEPRH